MTGSWFKTGKNDIEWYNKEKERVKNILNEKYKTDEVFRSKCIERNKLYYHKKKEQKKLESKMVMI